jgi:hypothetical protein
MKQAGDTPISFLSTGIPVKGRGGGRHDVEEAARAMLPSIHFNLDTPLKSFTWYVADFWKDDSPYAREYAVVRKKPLSAAYIKLHHDNVGRHIAPFPGFRGVTLQSLISGVIRDWMAWAAGKGMSGRRINTVLQSMRIAVRHAVSREELDRDLFKNIREAEEYPWEKGALTPVEVSRFIHAPATDPRGRLVVLLRALCGLGLGEVRGFLWRDIGERVITVRHMDSTPFGRHC